MTTASILLHSSKVVNLVRMKVYARVAETTGYVMSVETYELDWKNIRSDAQRLFLRHFRLLSIYHVATREHQSTVNRRRQGLGTYNGTYV